MRAMRIVAGSIGVSLLGWAGPASAGWVIDQVVKGEAGRQQVVLQANRMKTVMIGEDGKATFASIIDLNAQTMTQIDYQGRHYFTATVQEYAQTFGGAQQMAAGQTSQAMRQMQEALKEMPPEQRKMVEEAMRAQMGQAAAGPQECREPRIEVRRTGQQATIAGYPAVRYDILADGKAQSQLWIAKTITAWRELDPQKLERFMEEMRKLEPRCGPGKGRQPGGGVDPAWKLAGEGYPVRTVDLTGGGTTVEVVKAQTLTVPATEFQPPPGFARKTLREMMGQ